MNPITEILTLFALTFGIDPVRAAWQPAEVVKESFFTGAITCEGEQVRIDANLTVVTKTDKDGDIIQHTHLRGTGIGDGGTEYILNQQFHSIDDGVNEEVLERRVAFVSKGSESNLVLIITFDAATGEVHFVQQCVG
jgi:hypothetical protein